MEIPPVETELIHIGGQTNTTKLTAIFRNFAKSPKTGNEG